MLKAVIMVTCFVCLTTGAQPARALLSGQEISSLVTGASIEIDAPSAPRYRSVMGPW